MLNIDSLKLGPIPKVFLILVPWGVALLIGGIIHQNMGNPTPAKFLLVWAIVTFVGLAGHALGLCRGLELNFLVWVVAIALAWVFTFFVFQVYEPKGPNDPILYSDMGAVWLGLMGIAFIFTAFQVNRLFWLIAIPHLVIALGMELSARSIIKNDFLDANQPLLVALIDGGLTLIAGIVGVIWATRESVK
jgi:hypothetical protein